MSKELHIRLNARDRANLELIRELFGVSLSAAMRVAIRAASQKLGIDKETPDDFLKK